MRRIKDLAIVVIVIAICFVGKGFAVTRTDPPKHPLRVDLPAHAVKLVRPDTRKLRDAAALSEFRVAALRPARPTRDSGPPPVVDWPDLP